MDIGYIDIRGSHIEISDRGISHIRVSSLGIREMPGSVIWISEIGIPAL